MPSRPPVGTKGIGGGGIIDAIFLALFLVAVAAAMLMVLVLHETG